MCKQCGSLEASVVSNVGGMVMWRCSDCGKQELRRAQEPRGAVWRLGFKRSTSAASGEI